MKMLKCMILAAVVALWAGLLEPAEAGESPKGESLHVGVLSGPRSMNFLGATDVWSRKVLRLIHMPLYIRDPRDGSVLPWIAERKPESDPKGTIVTVRLKEAHWDDGTPVSSDDLLYTWEVIRRFNVPGHVEHWQMVERVEALDPRTIRFILKEPSAAFFNETLLTPFLQKKAWAPLIQPLEGTENAVRRLTGLKPDRVPSSGPFSIVNDPSHDFVLMKRNPHFFAQGECIAGMQVGPYVDWVVFHVYRNVGEALAALKNGEIDFYAGDVCEESVKELKNEPGLQFFRTDRRGYDYLGFNLRRPPYNDRAFRQAVAALIDREAMIDKAFAGDVAPARSVIPPHNAFWCDAQLQLPGDGLADDDARLDDARESLRKAGYTWEKNSLVLPTGDKMPPMELLTTPAGCRPDRFAAALLLKKWLARLGIPVTIRMLALQDLLKALSAGEFDVYLMGWTNLSDEPAYLNTFFHSREARLGGKNYPGFKNAEFDRLAESAQRQVDPLKRKEHVVEMQRLIAQELPYIPLYSKKKIDAVRIDRLMGWVPKPGGVGNLWSFLMLRPAKE